MAMLIVPFIGCDNQSANRIQHLGDSLSALNLRLDSVDSTLRTVQLDLYEYKIENEKGAVDFTEPGLQDIGDGFFVIGISVQQHLTGVKVSGRVLNSTSLLHTSVEFQITVGDQSKDFTVASIPSRTAVSFSVYIPDVPVNQTHWGQIKYQRALLNYYLK
jgi:hypothetical protein